MRRAARIDSNHTEIVKHFRYCGATVLSLAAMGKGVPDLLVSWRNVTWLVEIKAGKGKQNEDQQDFEKQWAGCMALVRSSEEVENVMRQMNFQAELLAVN
jgi:hypothetical protein